MKPRRDRADALTGATEFLKLAGDVTGGWLLAIGAVAGQRRLKDGEGDPAFAEGRIDIARFYAETTLAAAPGLVDSVRLGADFLPEDDALAST